MTLPSDYPGLIEGGIAIDLSNRELTSADLRSLSIHKYPRSNLIIVDLSSNQLTELPPEIGQLTSVQFLYLRDNQLKILPPEIGQLSRLETLVLQGNQLTELPPEIGRLQNLKELYLQGNPIQSIPPEITQKPGLAIYR